MPTRTCKWQCLRALQVPYKATVVYTSTQHVHFLCSTIIRLCFLHPCSEHFISSLQLTLLSCLLQSQSLFSCCFPADCCCPPSLPAGFLLHCCCPPCFPASLRFVLPCGTGGAPCLPAVFLLHCCCPPC